MIGAPQEGLNGIVYIFQKQGANWQKTFKLATPNLATSSVFGQSLAIYENTLVVGDEFGTPYDNVTTGCVHIFNKVNDKWEYISTLFERYPDTRFGTSISISGNFLAIGASWEHKYPEGRGAVFIYKKNSNNQWTKFQKIKEYGATSFGNTVSIHKNNLVIGDYESSEGSFSRVGSVFFYELRGDAWVLNSKKLPDDYNTDFYNFGYNVSISDNYTIVSSAGNRIRTPAGLAGYGKFFIYKKEISNWNLVQTLVPSDIEQGTSFTSAVSICKNNMLIGSKYGQYLYTKDADLMGNKIKGKIFQDNNANCQQDINDKGLEYCIVKAEPGPYYASINEKGEYELEVGKGTYTITQILPKHQLITAQQICPTNPDTYNVTFNSIGEVKTGICPAPLRRRRFKIEISIFIHKRLGT